MKSQYSLRGERGVAMLFELVLVALVLAVVGAAYYNMNSQRNAAAPAASIPTASTVANGKVSNTVNALIQDSATDGTSAQQEDSSMPATDTSSGDAQAASGSVDENSL